MSKISELRAGSGSAKDLSYQERAEGLNQLFTERVVPMLSKINQEAVDSEAQV